MLRFFRQLRQQLLTENRFSKYLLYALGEILLVVIGILLALQIDNWNEEQKDRRTELGIIKNLKEEFQVNLLELDGVLEGLNTTKEANVQLMGFFGKPVDELNLINIDSVMYLSVEFQRFIPAQNALTDLLQSGRLQLITNESLKNLLYDWSRILSQADESYSGIDQKLEVDILPFLTPLYPLKDIDMYGPLEWKYPSRLPNNKLEVFAQIEYESIVDDMLYRLVRHEKDLEKARTILIDILGIIENQK
ncbi:DUF6090 family protein [Robiginitalea sp. SC105]|uniref:DUF6090 family protein n=1 Tax=Robiginitalea sp. SC105 TaxID=2762332 RepID=UPI00163AF2EA|nr:DUF6090 family protein [Robiginitalea sp. SC105]MBC2839839.1 hypothetical protein [Robiginitalea sp. SC105]